jgi:alanine racemase
MIHSSYIELDFKALKKNIRYLKNEIGSAVKFVSVIKGNAYGHGIKDFVPLAEACGIDFFAVSDACEAADAFSVKSPGSKLIVMGMIDQADLKWIIENDISFFVFDLQRLEDAISISRICKKKAKIHLELETGMNRTGLDNDDLVIALNLIKKNYDIIYLEGICTHYAGAESIANYVRIHDQFNNFNILTDHIAHQQLKPEFRHTASSASTLLYPHTRMDLVRIGIAQYGFWPSNETKIYKLFKGNIKIPQDPLKQILHWKTKVMSIKTVQPAKFISYGNSFLTTKITKIAIIPVGYFHGYRRSLSNNGFVLIGGKKAPVIGMVGMNIFTADISNIPGVKRGDEVVLIGNQVKNKITVASFSELTNFVNYELLARLPSKIPRIVINKHGS